MRPKAVKRTSKGGTLDMGMELGPVKERFNGLAESGDGSTIAIARGKSIMGLILSGSQKIDFAGRVQRISPTGITISFVRKQGAIGQRVKIKIHLFRG